ncbi:MULTISPECIES: transposase [Candidatus Williamhamiltonella]|uniref:Transposase DDE domain-containing protein n=1 Tax=Candidatus Williamhamiltonella defendens TaxID=138072 RepID=A0A2D3TE04_9ENTR|nr:transposase [Candidatus Hamiltonella defensa]ATW33953.1 hypothetical protein BJP43_06430 [Candidatus Hamiltonella defensa]
MHRSVHRRFNPHSRLQTLSSSASSCFRGITAFGETSTGGVLDLNDILIIHHLGEILSMRFTRGNVDDRMTAPDLGKNITGQIYADNY